MFDKDSKLLFEAYRDVVNEAPIDPGGAWDMPSADITGKLSDLKSKRTGETVDSMLARFSAVTPETRIKIIDFTRQLLKQYEGSHFGGSAKQFALELADKIKPYADEWGFKAFRSPHISRVVVNVLLDLDVFTKDGKVQDVDKLEDEEEVLDMPAKQVKAVAAKPAAPKAVTGFELSAKYDIDRDVPMTVSDDAKMAHQNLLKQGMLFGQHTGKDLVKASGLSYAKAKEVLPELEKAGAIIKAEKETRDDDDVEALDYSEEDPSRVAFDLTKGGTDTIGTAY